MAKNSIIFSIGIIITAVAVGYLFTSGSTTTPVQNEVPLELLFLDKEEEMPFDACLARGLSDKVVILETEYCTACKIVVPRMKEIEQELNKEFIFLDLSKKEDAERLKEFKIIPQYTPTVLIDCNIYIGAHPKEKYKSLIKSFIDKSN